MSVTRKQVIGGIVDVLLMIIIAAVAAFVVLKAVGLAGVNRFSSPRGQPAIN